MFSLIGMIIFAYGNINTSDPKKTPPDIQPNVTFIPDVTGDKRIVPTVSSTIDKDIPGPEVEEFENNPNYLGSFERIDSTTVYSFTSTNSSRQNIYITANIDEFIFQREVISPEYPVFIQNITDQYGQPEQIISGSKFYGSEAQLFVYANLGMAFIVNQKNNQVYEQHLFRPMNVNDYVTQFGDDIP